MATLYTPTCSTSSERFPGPLSHKHECLHFDLESCNLMCIYTVVTDPCHIPPLAQARPMMLCIYTSIYIRTIRTLRNVGALKVADLHCSRQQCVVVEWSGRSVAVRVRVRARACVKV